MRNFLKYIAVIAVISLLFSSCKSKSEAAKMVPSDAVLVTYFNTKSLLEKLPYEDVKNTELFKDAYANTKIPEWSKKFLNDPKATGIDLEKGVTFFIQKGSDDLFTFVLEGALSDAGNFEKFNKNLDSAQSPTDQKGIKSMTIKDGGVAAWNDKNFVYVFNTTDNSSQLNNWEQHLDSVPSIPKGDLNAAKAFALRLFSLPSDSSLAKDDRYNSLINENGDMKVWVNSEKLMSLTPSLGMLSMLKMDAIVKDSRTAYNIVFDNGKITADQKSYYGKDMLNILKKYKGDDVKAEDIAKVPSKDIVGILAFNFKPEGLKETFKLLGLDGMINMSLSQMGLSFDDIIAAIDGRMLVSFSDLKANLGGDSTGMTRSDVDFNILYKTGINDKAKFQKLLDVVNKMMGMTNASDVYYNSNDKAFALSNHKEFADNYLAGKQDNKPEWLDKITGHPAGLYVNINKILNSIQLPSDSIGSAMLQNSRAVWNDITAVGGEVKDDALVGTTTVTFMDKNTNSLKILNKYSDEMYRLGKEKKKLNPGFQTTDSTAAIIDTVHTVK